MTSGTGNNIHPNRSQLLTITVVLGLSMSLLVLSFSFQGSRGIWQPDEGYYAGTAVTMLAKDSFFIPYLGEHEIFLDKPPMIYWGIIMGLKTFGHNEFAVRFFHGLCFVLTSLAVGSLSYSLFKDRKGAIISSLIYATMVVPFLAANFVTPDTILTLWTTLSAICFFHSFTSEGKRRILWQMLLCGCVGLGFLAKGPAILIPCGGMFVFLIVKKDLRRYFLTPWSIVGILIFTVLGLGWYIWIGLKIPGSLSYFMDNQIWGRLFTEKYHRNPGLSGALIYAPVLLFGSLPWSIIWLKKKGFLRSTLFSKNWWRSLPGESRVLFLLCYFFVPLLILCLASSKLGFYALPIFVPLAIATATLWARKISTIKHTSFSDFLASRARPLWLIAGWIFLLLFSKLALTYYPTHYNIKDLWAEVNPHIPAGEYELCTVDERADGLLFYGVKRVEHLTNKSHPYPAFTETETVLEEIRELLDDKENAAFLVIGDNHVAKVLAVLKNSGIECRVVHLRHQRALLFPCLAGKSVSGIRRYQL